VKFLSHSTELKILEREPELGCRLFIGLCIVTKSVDVLRQSKKRAECSAYCFPPVAESKEETTNNLNICVLDPPPKNQVLM